MPMAMDKVVVEAEQAPGGGAVLTLKDVSLRRKLVDEVGEHNVRLNDRELLSIGFPDQFFDDLHYGRPVQFKMNYGGFKKLLTGRSRLNGLEGGFEGWVSVYVYTKNWDLDDKVRAVAERYGGEHTGSGTFIETGERDNSFSFRDMTKAKRAAAALRRVRGVSSVEIIDMREESDYMLHGLDLSTAQQIGPFPFNIASRRAQQLMDHGAMYVRLQRQGGAWVVNFVR